MSNRKGFEVNFAWLFSLFIGACVLFFAIYLVTTLIDTSSSEYNTELAAEIGAVLSPVETSVESGTRTRLSIPEGSEMRNLCHIEGPFGEQEISVRTTEGLDDRQRETGISYRAENRYLFSAQALHGPRVEVFAKPFNLPYKVGDILVLYTGSYCFVSAPNEIREEVEQLALPGVNLTESVAQCPQGSTTVCFNEGNCNITVDSSQHVVRKKNTVVRYVDELVYGAIFADQAIYECQVQRLLKRTALLAQVYADKTDFLTSQGCASNLGAELRAYASELGNASSASLGQLYLEAYELDRRNNALSCKLF